MSKAAEMATVAWVYIYFFSSLPTLPSDISLARTGGVSANANGVECVINPKRQRLADCPRNLEIILIASFCNFYSC